MAFSFGSADPYGWITDPDPALLFSTVRFKMATKKIVFLLIADRKYIASVFKEGFSLFFCLLMEGPEPEHCFYPNFFNLLVAQNVFA